MLDSKLVSPYTQLTNQPVKVRNYLLILLILGAIQYTSRGQACEGPLSVTIIGATSNEPIVIDEESSGVYCTKNKDGEIYLTVYGGTPEYKCKWAHDDTGEDFLTDLAPGSYHVTVTDHNGCTDERTITLYNMDPLLDSLDLVDMSACGDCYMYDGTQSYFYFEDEYIAAIIDHDTDMNLGDTRVCADIVEDTPYYYGDPMLVRCWTVETDSMEESNYRLFFEGSELDQLAEEVGYADGNSLLYSFGLYVNVYAMDHNFNMADDPFQLNMSDFTITKYDEETDVWSLELRDLDDAKVELVAFAGALPLELLSFEGEAETDYNHLFWSTANEVDLEGFEVQRSASGIAFDSIGYVESGNNEYTFDDYKALYGDNYYRLMLLDIDGSFKYSHIIRLEKDYEFEFRVVNNPFSQTLHLEVISQKDFPADVAIIGINGQTYFNSDYSILSGVYNIEIPLEHIESGNYIVRFQNQTTKTVFSKKVVKI